MQIFVNSLIGRLLCSASIAICNITSLGITLTPFPLLLNKPQMPLYEALSSKYSTLYTLPLSFIYAFTAPSFRFENAFDSAYFTKSAILFITTCPIVTASGRIPVVFAAANARVAQIP
jgi:hypothetical protein